MEGHIKLSPAMIEAYRQIKLPIQTIDDITGRDSTSIFLFSDYGPITTNYETYAYYLIDGERFHLLISLLQGLKASKGIEGERIQYKSRKKPLKRAAFPKWIDLIRSYPGLLYIVAFDTRLEKQLYITPQKKIFQEENKSVGLFDNINIYKRMIRALGFIVTLLPYFRSKHNLVWAMDNDDIVMTDHRIQVLENSLVGLIEDAGGSQIAFPQIYIPPNTPESAEIDTNVEELLSVADIAASSFGQSLDYDKSERFKYPDMETAEILQELSRITDISEYKIERRLYCTIGSSIFEFQQTEDNRNQYFHNYLRLSPNIPLDNKSKGKRVYIKGYK